MDFEDKTFFRFNDINLYLVMQPIAIYDGSYHILFVCRGLERDDESDWLGGYKRTLKDHQNFYFKVYEYLYLKNNWYSSSN